MPSSPPDVHIRRATLADIPALARHRVGMYRDMGHIPASQELSFIDTCADYFRIAIASGEYLAWLALPSASPHEVVAGAGLIVRDMIPRPSPSGEIEVRDAQVVNVYTELAWRRRGIAALLMRHVIEYTHSNQLGRVSLHASDDGRPLYESLGFEPTNEMRLARPAE